MIGEAFTVRRERRGMSIIYVAELIESIALTVRRFEYGILHYTKSDAREMLILLNILWTIDDYQQKDLSRYVLK